MIKQIDNTMNTVACFQAPIIDALSEIVFVGAGLAGVYGIYLAVTGKPSEGGVLIGTGLLAVLSSSYTKEISQTVEKSCRV